MSLLYSIYINCMVAGHGGRDRGGQGGHGPSNNLVGGAIMYLAPQYFALEFKILTLGLMQREENMFPRSAVLDVYTL